MARMKRRTWSAALLPMAAAALLVACGGGLYIGIDGSDFDDPPDVSLVVDATSASEGRTLRFSAAASDDHGVDRVELYRRDRDGSLQLIGIDRGPPWEWAYLVGATPRGELEFFARAVDFAGQRSDSNPVRVTVR